MLLLCRNFLELFGPSSPYPMPQQLQSFLHHLQEQLLQEPVFRSHSVLYELMTAGACCHRPPHSAHCCCACCRLLQQLRRPQHAKQVCWCQCFCAAGGGCQFQPGDMTLAHNITAAYAAQVRPQACGWVPGWHARAGIGVQCKRQFACVLMLRTAVMCCGYVTRAGHPSDPSSCMAVAAGTGRQQQQQHWQQAQFQLP